MIQFFILSAFAANCHSCGMAFMSKARLTKHINGCVLGDPRQYLFFKTKVETERWVAATERETKSYFSKRRGDTKTKNKKYTYKKCQHDYREQPQFIPKTDRKRKFGVVPDFHCPAKICIVQDEDGYVVKFFSRHNHECSEENLKFQPLPVSVRNRVRNNLEMEVAPRRIYDDEKSEKWSRERRVEDPDIEKSDYLSQR